jgi:hypothetical protein
VGRRREELLCGIVRWRYCDTARLCEGRGYGSHLRATLKSSLRPKKLVSPEELNEVEDTDSKGADQTCCYTRIVYEPLKIVVLIFLERHN